MALDSRLQLSDAGTENGDARLTRAFDRWHRRAQPMLGTLVVVEMQTASDAGFAVASERAFARLHDFHVAMSFHEAASDVRAIARARAGSTLRVRRDTWQVLAAAQAFERDSGGVFDVAVAGHLVASGLLPAPGGDACAAGAAQRSALASLRLHDDGSITVVRPVWIDLGGIAKGAAVDAALQALRECGATAARVNAGGDLRVYGEAAHKIVVQGPNGLRVAAGTLADGAIATSGPFDDGALVVGAGNRAAWHRRSVSVVAPGALVADALTKVVAVLGHDAAPILERHAAHAFSIDGLGRLETVQGAAA